MTEEKETKKDAVDDGLKILALELSVRSIAIALEQIERRMQKWDEVYYHVFPDRVDKDIQFERQLTKLMIPKTDDDKKKS